MNRTKLTEWEQRLVKNATDKYGDSLKCSNSIELLIQIGLTLEEGDEQ